MIDQHRPLILSLRPRFATAILDGSKTAEVRRRRVCVPPGTLAILYASTPVMAVVGTALVKAVHVLAPDDAWRTYGNSTDLQRTEFDAYLEGSAVACIICLHRAQPIRPVLPLRELRELNEFQPPQSYRFVTRDDPHALRELALDR